MTKGFIFLLFFLMTITVQAQKCDQVLFFGRVKDTLRPQHFYNLMLVNKSTGRGVFGQPDGSFSVYVKPYDTILISVKQYPIQSWVIKPDTNCQMRRLIFIEGAVQEIQQVYVRPLKSLNQIKEEREALALRETRMVSGIEMMQSPITALYQTFSKKEKAKRWIAEQEYKDNQRMIVKELIRTYVAYDVIQLTEEEFDSFISFLNLDENFLKTATEMELITFIKDKFEHFKSFNRMDLAEVGVWRAYLLTDKQIAIEELLKHCVAHKMIDLPEQEYAYFSDYLGFESLYLKNTPDVDIYTQVILKYKSYFVKYHLDVEKIRADYHISEDDMEDWRWELKVRKSFKKAKKSLFRLMNEKGVIYVDEAEFERFSNFLNLKESFLLESSTKEIISFYHKKYLKYVDFTSPKD